MKIRKRFKEAIGPNRYKMNPNTVTIEVELFFESGNGWFLEIPAPWCFASDPNCGTHVEDTKKELINWLRDEHIYQERCVKCKAVGQTDVYGWCVACDEKGRK